MILSTPLPPRDIVCPTCGAEIGRMCRTLTYGTQTGPHSARWKQSHERREAALRQRKI